MSDHSHSNEAHAPVDKTVYRQGFNTFLLLGLLTGVEYVVGIISEPPSAVLLILLAIAKAALVMNVFMGVTKLWREGDHH